MTKTFSAFIAAVLSVLLVSCASGGLRIPGEKKLLTGNISAEYLSIADAYLDLKNYSKAAEYYKLACRDKNIRNSAYYKMARSYALAKDWKNALPAFERLLRLDPDNTDFQSSLAYVYAMSGDLDNAQELYKSILDRNQYDQSNFENYINILIADENLAEAEKAFETFRMNFPDSTQISAIEEKLDNLKESSENPAESESETGTEAMAETENALETETDSSSDSAEESLETGVSSASE